ncbi:fimbrial biogenesis chaperone, partial [Enterobacter kobei]|uniref:fimbrial biogenesis chaperone n=1 Tax=Enterobacter kobei TaxID=208224 RepID=UPI003CE6CC69
GISILMLGLLGQPASAASLQVSPTWVNFDAKEQARSVWLSNSGSDIIRGQVRLFNWQQKNGQELLTPSTTMVATPAIVTIQPGQKQLVRLVLPQRASTKEPVISEKTYRLVVNELPASSEHANGLQFLLSYSVPVFVNQKNASSSQTPLQDVNFSLDTINGKPVLTVDNHQGSHIKISQVTFTPGNGKAVTLVPGLLGYTLAKQKMQWPINASESMLKNGGVLSAMVNNDTKPQKLPVRGS